MEKVVYKTKCRRKLGGGSFHKNPLLDIAYRRRGIHGMSRITYKFSDLLPYNTLKDIDKATAIIAGAVANHKRILILADYDCDGASACAVMYRSLRRFGAKFVDYEVPDRSTMGYGTTPALVDHIANKQPDLIITVDNGISSFAGVEHIRKILPNTKIVVTDHHMPKADGSLPDADAIVNPNQQGCTFPSKAICGCGVAWYVAMSVNDYLEQKGYFVRKKIKKPNLSLLIDIVALATIADVVSMDDYNNRLIVDVGLRLIRKGVQGIGNIGIKELFNISRIRSYQAKSSDLGFSIGPLINSAGRMFDMKIGITCLISDDKSICTLAANELDKTNKERKQIQKEMLVYARKAVIDVPNALSLVVYDENFHEGVIGLVSARLREDYGVPTFVFSKSENGMLKASGRSIENVHLFNVLTEIDSRTGILHNGFGGHAMAAGLSLKEEDLPLFISALEDIVSNIIKKPQDTILNDGLIDPLNLTYENIIEMKLDAPWGQHFPEPVFESIFFVKDIRIFGHSDNHLEYTFADNTGATYSGIAFSATDKTHVFEEIKKLQRVKVSYRVDIDEYKGKHNPKLILESLKAV